MKYLDIVNCNEIFVLIYVYVGEYRYIHRQILLNVKFELYKSSKRII